MLAKLNGTSSLPTEAQGYLDRYKGLLKQMTEAEATEATINLVYKTYYSEMGGVGAPPEVKAQSNHQPTSNVTALKRSPASRPAATRDPRAKPRLPVALIFACLVVVYVGLRYFWP
jgi:hypothetical protein